MSLFANVCGEGCRRILGRVVKALDLSPSGHSPRGFEPRRMQTFCKLKKTRSKNAPRVRLELTTYRLTAGRAADCAIQELLQTPHHKM